MCRIGEWLADREANELRRDRDVVRIEPKAMDVLMALAARAGRVVSRDELFAAVWPGVVVGDEALTQTVIKLRKALGDDARTPSYIETIAKRGYRLLAPVAVDAGREAPRDRRRVTAIVLLTVVAIMCIVAAWRIAEQPVTPGADGGERSPGFATVTVMPFESADGGPEQAYLARGLSDDLAGDLSRLSDLRVIRASAAVPAAAERARYRVSGSVYRDADELRVTIHLSDTRTGEELWSQRFTRPFGDLFAVRDEINAKLLQLLPGKVSDIERARLARRYTHSLDAYDSFLRAQALFLVRGSEENEKARALYRRAIELDPAFARAYAGLAMTYAIEHRLNAAARAASLDRARDLAQTARGIDPELPEVHWALGFVHAQARQHAEAIAALQKAIELEPSFADAYAFLGGIRTYTGDPERSVPLLRTAMRLNPDGGYLYLLLLGRAYLFVGDHEQALINLRAAALRNPADVETRVYLAATLAASGDRAAARWEVDEIRALDWNFSLRRWLETYPMTSASHRERLTALLDGVM